MFEILINCNYCSAVIGWQCRVLAMRSLVRWLSTCQHSLSCHCTTLYREPIRLLVSLYRPAAHRQAFCGVISFQVNYSVLANVITWNILY